MTNDRPFLFCTGIGFDASVIRRVERHGRWLKRMASHPLHIAAAFHTFFSADGRRVRVDITIERGLGEGGESIHDVRFAIVSKTTPYTHLGRLPLHVNRNAGLDTRLSLTAFTRLRALAHRRRRFVDPDGQVPARPQGRRAARRPRRPPRARRRAVPYQVDGDDVGDTNELRIGLETDALTVAIPPPAPHRERS